MLKLPVISLRRLLQIISRELKAATTATKTSLENAHLGNGDYLVIIGLLQQTITWYMVAGTSLLFPHWDIKTKASQASLVQVSLF